MLAFHKRPALQKAAELIARDNGAINRTSSIDAVLNSVSTELNCNFTLAQLDTAEAELSVMSKEALEDVCCGEQGDVKSVTDKTDEILDEIFNNI